MNKPTHITTDDVLEYLGFYDSDSALKIKVSIMEGILHEIERCGYKQSDLVELLDERQPNVSNLMHGRISKVSIEKLLGYADRLGMTIGYADRLGMTITLRRRSQSSLAEPTENPT